MSAEQKNRPVATEVDYLNYFEIPKVVPGTESWREAVNLLIAEIRSDLEASALPEKEASSLIDSLLYAREVSR
ncbi:MAG: hypothetical protein ACREBG_17750 [Pyrinomonadaceae bacterium]